MQTGYQHPVHSDLTRRGLIGAALATGAAAALPDKAAAKAAAKNVDVVVSVDAPWTAASAAEWDGQTLETWVEGAERSGDEPAGRGRATERFRRLVPAVTRPVFGAEPRELSLLFVLSR